MNQDYKFQSGKSYTLFVPPSWILVAEVVEDTGKHVVTKNIAYIESVNDGVATMAIGIANPDVKKSVAKSYPFPDGTVFHKDGILIACPCDVDTSPLYAQREGNAIRGRK